MWKTNTHYIIKAYVNNFEPDDPILMTAGELEEHLEMFAIEIKEDFKKKYRKSLLKEFRKKYGTKQQK